jgi:hypothetical protein
MNVCSPGLLLNCLAGYWNIERIIEGEGATLRGTASLLPTVPGVLAYKETGQLRLQNGRTLETFRCYHYRLLESAIEIDFGDGPANGQLFVRLDFGNSLQEVVEAQDVHYCGKDIYRVLYRLRLPMAFESEIEVSGPNKAYRALSRYTKLS